jgi:hypothetical protein
MRIFPRRRDRWRFHQRSVLLTSREPKGPGARPRRRLREALLALLAISTHQVATWPLLARSTRLGAGLENDRLGGGLNRLRRGERFRRKEQRKVFLAQPPCAA